MKALITGGTGFLGSHLADELLSRGARVRLFARGTSLENVEHILSRVDLGILRGDITDERLLREAVRGTDVVFHLASFTNVRESAERPFLDARTSVLGTVNVLQAMADEGVKKLVFVSAGRVYGNVTGGRAREDTAVAPVEAYGLGKAVGEMYCRLFERQFGVQIIILRLYSVYGPRQLPRPGSTTGVVAIFASRFLAEEDVTIYGDGSLRRDLLYVKDFCEACRLITEQDRWGAVFNVGSGTTVTVKALAEKLKELIRPARATIRNAEPLPGDVDLVPDISLLREKTGFEPHYDLDHGLRETVSWLRTHLSPLGRGPG